MLKNTKVHLEKSNTNYSAHLLWALHAGMQLIWAGIASIIHAVVPSLFPGTAAKTVIDLYHTRLKNHPNSEYQSYIDKFNKD